MSTESNASSTPEAATAAGAWYDRDADDRDWWGQVVVGFPAYQRHQSGSGFKRVPMVSFDFNAAHWLDESHGLLLKWIDNADDAADLAVGDVVFIYEEHDEPPFGYIAKVTHINADRSAATVELQGRPRYQGWVDSGVVASSPPKKWLPRYSFVCQHMSVSSSARISKLDCAQCASVAASSVDEGRDLHV